MEQLKTYSPIDNSLYVTRDYATDYQITETVALAQQAQLIWKDTSISERAAYCEAMVLAMLAEKEAIATEISWQMGRPIRYAAGELNGFAERAQAMIAKAQSALEPLVLPEKPGFTRYIKREPLGVVLVIAPWNYPFLTAVNAIIPAIMAGNTVILKHSAQTPLVAERFAEAFGKAKLPKGVFNYLHLTHQDTLSLMQMKAINHVAFTGSVAGGDCVEKAIAGRFISAGLELGGKDPAYVRDDADVDAAVAVLVDGAFFNSGQSCCGIERIYVHESIYPEFLKKAVKLTQQYKLGPSDDPETTLGPMVRAQAADFVREQIKEALVQGAVAHLDPHDFPLDKPGTSYLAPQILTGVDHSMRVMFEESFGPVVGIMPVSSDEEAVRLMNDSEYGLTAVVCTRDLQKGIEIGDQLQTGTFFINRCDYLDPDLAWTGVKNSGKGCTLSSLGYEYLTRPKSYHLKLGN